MSQGTLSSPGPSASAQFDAPRESFDEFAGEFNYRPVPVLAPVTLFLGVCGVISLFGIIGVFVSLFGVIFGTVCLMQILGSKGELGGVKITGLGLVFSIAFLVSGSTLHAYNYATEVPEGFRRINFTQDISKKGFVTQANGASAIHPDVQQLDGQKVFLKGFMYPELQTENLTRFVFVKDNQQCCFGGQPNPADMILIEMEPGKTADYSTGLVAIAGTFHAQDPGKAAGLTTVYRIEGHHFSRAKTSF